MPRYLVYKKRTLQLLIIRHSYIVIHMMSHIWAPVDFLVIDKEATANMVRTYQKYCTLGKEHDGSQSNIY